MEGRRAFPCAMVSKQEGINIVSYDAAVQLAITTALREGREIGLEAAIMTAKMFLEGGHTVACVVAALEDLRKMVNEVAPNAKVMN